MNNNIWAIASFINEETGEIELGEIRYFGQKGMITAGEKIDKLNEGLQELKYFLVVVGHK